MDDLEKQLKDLEQLANDLENPGVPVGMLVLYICLGVFIGLPCLLLCVAAIYHTYQEYAVRTIPAANKDKRCVVNCLCGETQISFRNYTPRLRCECMCYDCCQRWDWQKSQGCNLEDYWEHWAHIDGRGEQYIDNAVTEVKGKENLETWCLREGSKMRMLVCGKCKYVMVNSHEMYNGVIVLVKARTSDCEKIPIDIRGFQKYWPRPEREGPVPGPDRPLPTLESDHTHVITGGFCNLLMTFYKGSLIKCYNNLPYKEPGDMDVRDFFEAEPSIAGIAEFQEVKMDHKNIGKLSQVQKEGGDVEKH